MEPIVERILSVGGGLFEERGGRLFVKGTDVDLAEVWEVVNPVPQWPSRADALHQFMCSRGIDRDLAEALAGYVLKHPVTVEDYYRHAEVVVELTRLQTEGNLLDSTKPHWSLDQSLQEARDHINILHKEIDDLKQHIANLQATSLTLIGQMWTIRGILPAMLRGLVVAEPEEIDKRLAQMDEVFSGAYSEMEKAVGHITDGPLRILLDPSPELVKILSRTMAEVAAFQESA